MTRRDDETTKLSACDLQKQVARTEQEILNRIKKREVHVSELKRRLEGVKVRGCLLPCSRVHWFKRCLGHIDLSSLFQNYADRERGEVEHLLDELSGSLDQIRSQVVGGIQNQLDAVMSKGEGLVSRLEEELGQLTDRRATLEVQAISQDHISFLQVTHKHPPARGVAWAWPHRPRLLPLRASRRPLLLWMMTHRKTWMRTPSCPCTSAWGR